MNSTAVVLVRNRLLVLALVVLHSGCDGSSSPTPPADSTPPSPITDLSASLLRGGGVRLAWTAPGDDAMTGQASQYSIRYSPSPVTDETWSSTAMVEDPPTPGGPGADEDLVVADPGQGTWYFAVRTADEVPNWSGLSNIASATVFPDTLPPDPITDLTAVPASASSVRLEWSAPADDGDGGASAYEVRYATGSIDETTWDEAMAVPDIAPPGEAGASEALVVEGLLGETEYFFAIRSADTVPNWSDLSNVVSATTSPDEIAPAAIDDLTIAFRTPTTLSLRWTGTGDDGHDGTAAEIDVRYASSPITEETWDGAVSFESLPDALESGATMVFRATGLASGTTLHVAVRTADERPNWSPLSNVVAAVMEPVMPLTTSPAETSADSPAWSPDGTRLAVRANWHDPVHDQIHVLELISGEWERVTRDVDYAWYPSWSPISDLIAYMTHRYEDSPVGDDEDTGLWVQEPNLTAKRTLLARHGDGDFVRSSTWSPDGTEIAYGITLGVPPTVGGIFVVPSSGGTVRVLANEGSRNGGPSWSPDGASIAFHSNRTGNSDIYLVSASGGEPVGLVMDPSGDTYPAYSPDGTMIAFVSDRGGSLDLWLMPSAGGEPVRLTSDAGVDTTPAWSPSGDEIAFRSNRSGSYEVWVLDVATAKIAPR